MDLATQISEPIAATGSYAVADETPKDREPAELLPWLPCTLALEVPIVKFTIGTLLALTPGALVESAWHQSTDIPLRVNGLLMAWTEFEVVGERLAARITDLV
jgi:flagellar motor switch/type III secretory pathway protein FliN